jgi:Domain of unknown function (DUF4349)
MTKTSRATGAAITGAVLLIGCCVLIASCSGGSTSSSAGPAAAHAPVASAGSYRAALSGAAAANGEKLTEDELKTVQTGDLTPASQSIIYTASMTVRTANAAAAAKRAIAIVVAAGGYTADERAVSSSPGTTGQTVDLTLKVPVPAYQTVLAQLSSPALGKQISVQQQATDVTQQVADVSSLVTSQQDAIAALQGLLQRAGSVTGLLQVQQQISADESSLDSLLAQQRALDHETSYATVTMTFAGPQRQAPRKVTRHGFLAGLAAGWRALRHATEWLLTAAGTTLPFLIVAVVLAGIGYAGRRRFIRRRTRPTTAG